jgi:hypothetical protein
MDNKEIETKGWPHYEAKTHPLQELLQIKHSQPRGKRELNSEQGAKSH